MTDLLSHCSTPKRNFDLIAHFYVWPSLSLSLSLSLFPPLPLSLLPPSLPPFSPHSVGKYLRQLKLGSDLLKIKKTKNFPRIYRLDEDLQSISWNSHHKKAIKAKSKYYISFLKNTTIKFFFAAIVVTINRGTINNPHSTPERSHPYTAKGDNNVTTSIIIVHLQSSSTAIIDFPMTLASHTGHAQSN